MSRPSRIVALAVALGTGLAVGGWYVLAGGGLTVTTWRTADAETARRYDLHTGAYDYLHRALVTLRPISLRRDSVDWPALRQAAFAEAQGAQTPEATYPALRLALRRLEDGHSFFLPPPGARPAKASSDAAAPDAAGPGASDAAPDTWPTARLVETSSGARLGSLRVPAVMGRGEAAYTDSLRGGIRAVAAQGPPCGWIVDVRGNTGGNMWPMLAGLGPVVGPGRLGAFVGADGTRQPWFYADGEAGLLFWRGWLPVGAAEVDAPPHRFERAHPPVAVLTDGRTASSGEAVAVAFRGRPHARSFGTPTKGLTTGNQEVRLSDGARLFVTASVYADRTGRVYGGPLVPDVPTSDPEADAQAWLAQRPECAR